ncbi:MFS transporter [Paenarthrobacter nicotinovorans]|uniref:MFS transporter n=1 Tax=Paenarthrobacter nicotinovorans TaxID=29320 RepID=UPI00381DFDB2
MSVSTDNVTGLRRTARSTKPRMVRTAVVVGTALEHYDFFLYGTAAALVFNGQYFTSENPLVASMAAFATFAVGFAARPLGAILFGHLGDTIGRRHTLIITLLLIGISTGAIGLVPNYAAIGIWAPIMLVTLRFAQGVSFGGEWAGAVILASEHAPKGKEGRYASLPQLGSPIGNIISSAAFLCVGLLPAEAFNDWGWRIPFLAAFPLLAVALWVRTKVEESPAFKEAAEHDGATALPALQVLKSAPGALLISAALAFISIGGFFLVTTFAISYGTGTVGLSSATMLIATLSAAAVQIVTVVITGHLADRIAPIKIALFGCAFSGVLAVPAVLALATGIPVLAVIAIVVIIQPIAITYSVTGVILPRLFEAKVRYSGVALGYNVAGFVGGFVPMIATSLLLASDSQAWPIAAMLVAIVMISIAGALGARRRLQGMPENASPLTVSPER